MRTKNTHIIRVLLGLLLIGLFLSTELQAQDTLPKSTVQAYFNDARAFANKNQMDLSLQAIDKASKLAEQNEDAKGLIDSYHKFSIHQMNSDKVDNSLFYLDRASALLKDVEYPFGNATHKYIMAMLKYREGNHFLAIYELEEAKQLSNDRNLYNNILLAEGNIYLDLEKYDAATKNFNSLVINTDPYEKEYLATQAYLGLAKAHLFTQNYEEGANAANNALELAKQYGFIVEIKAANQLLSGIYEKMGQYDLALKNSKNLLGIGDSIFTVEKLKIEAKTYDKVNIDFMTDEIKRLEQKTEELSQSVKSSEIAAILTSAFLTIISLLAVSLYRNNQIKLKTNELLQTKNNELQSARDAAVQAMEAKTNFLSTVSHELRTPLYAVTGLTHLLLEENPSKNQKEHLKSLKFSGEYLLHQ